MIIDDDSKTFSKLGLDWKLQLNMDILDKINVYVLEIMLYNS